MTEPQSKPIALWLSVNPSWQPFDREFLSHLGRHARVFSWDFRRERDEPHSLERAIASLHEVLQTYKRPMHLIGHGISGVVGLLYVRQYPEWVRSLSLLSVGANPALTWHAHYYSFRQLLPGDRASLLAEMAQQLFGSKLQTQAADFVELMSAELDSGFAPHSLAGQEEIDLGGIEPPLLVCCGANDPIVDRETRNEWLSYFKSGDRLWSCPRGTHFLHYDCPKRIAREIDFFWQQLPLKQLSVVGGF